MRVVLAGGGSAGHIEPALALADALRQADSSIQVTCLGTQRGLETRLVPLRGYELELIPAVPLPRSVTPQLLTVPGRLAGAVHAVGTILDRVGADVLVGFGGYVATPAYLAAKRHKVPIVVHEANPLAGIANRLGAHLTTHVFTGHPDTKLRNGKYLGLPIRRQIAELDRFALGDKARAHFGLRPDLPVLLVSGGSQGAVSLNRALAGAVGAITSAGVQVLHVTGPKHLNEIQAPPGPVPYVAVPYVDRMDLAYAAADFALCRAGAMTCAELTAVGLPAAYVPLPHGNGEQRLNALPIVQRGGGLLVDDAELTAELDQDLAAPGADQHRPGGRHVGGRGGDGQEGRRPLAGEGGHRHRRRRGGQPRRRTTGRPRPAAGRRQQPAAAPRAAAAPPAGQWAPPRPPPPPAARASGTGQPVHSAYPPSPAGRGLDAAAGRRPAPGPAAEQPPPFQPGQSQQASAAGSALRPSAAAAGPATQPPRPARRPAPRPAPASRPDRPRPPRTRIRVRDVTGRRGYSGGGEGTRAMALVTPTEPVPLEELGRVHFVGIGGAGMSGIARIMLARGVDVSGSDTTARLGRAGRAGGARGPGAASATRPAISATPTRWSCPARSGRTTRSWSRRTAGACGWCTGPPRSAR